MIFNIHIMNVNHAKFQKKFDSRKISRELPLKKIAFSSKKNINSEFEMQANQFLAPRLDRETYPMRRKSMNFIS